MGPPWWYHPVIAIAVVASLTGATPEAHAGIISGVQKIVMGVLPIPVSTLMGTFSGPPILGTVMGALNGTISGVGLVLGGVFDIASGAIPLAKAAAPYVLPFVL